MKIIKRKLLPLAYNLAKIYWKIFKPTTLGVRVIIEVENKILLVKHSYRSDYFFPGGAVKKFEEIESGARREVNEEVGIELGELSFQGIYRLFDEGKNDILVVLATNVYKGDIKIDEIEIIESKWFELDNLPENINPPNKIALDKYMKK